MEKRSRIKKKNTIWVWESIKKDPSKHALDTEKSISNGRVIVSESNSAEISEKKKYVKRNLERGDLRAANLTLEHCSNCAIESPPLKAKFRISRKTDDPRSHNGV